mgnify:CR=1 FL=1
MATVLKLKRSEVAQAVPSGGSLVAGEIAMNVTDGKFYTKTSGGTVKEVGGAGSVTLQNVMTNGATTTTNLVLDQGQINLHTWYASLNVQRHLYCIKYFVPSFLSPFLGFFTTVPQPTISWTQRITDSSVIVISILIRCEIDTL